MSDMYVKTHYNPAVKQLKTALDLSKEAGAPAQVTEAIAKALELCEKRDGFVNSMTCQESETCLKIKNETWSHNWKGVHEAKKTSWNLSPGMMSGHVEGQFLKSFLSAQKAKRVLDIGMFTGYSAMSIAEVLPADGQIVTLDIEEYLKDLVKDLVKDSPHKDKISIIIGKGLESMEVMHKEGEQFDAVFMDAAKSEYPEYMRLCLDGNLLAPGGTLLVDNAFLHGKGYLDPESATAKFAALLKTKTDLHVVLVPIRDGIYLIRRRVDVDGGVV